MGSKSIAKSGAEIETVIAKCPGDSRNKNAKSAMETRELTLTDISVLGLSCLSALCGLRWHGRANGLFRHRDLPDEPDIPRWIDTVASTANASTSKRDQIDIGDHYDGLRWTWLGTMYHRDTHTLISPATFACTAPINQPQAKR
jgi:hypothetical protein